MKDYTNSAPQFADKIKILEPTDPGHADNFNPPVKQLLQNTLVLKNVLEESELMGGDAEAPNRLDVMQEKIEALQVPEIPEPSPSEGDTRENISQGDDQPTLWKKVKRWFADLKSGAFANVANNCTETEEGTVLDGRQGKVLQDEIDELKEADSEINSNIKNIPIVRGYNLGEKYVGAVNEQSWQVNIAYTGYTPISISGWDMRNGGMYPWRLYIDDSYINLTVRSVSQSGANINPYVKIGYVKSL